MRIKCPDCNGTGTEQCEVHGNHKCERCNGKGCIERVYLSPWKQPPWKPYYPCPSTPKPYTIQCQCGGVS